MYLTQIKHDFNFSVEQEMDEVLSGLTFQHKKRAPLFPLFKSKVVFHSNQGRNVSLLWGYALNSTVKNYTFVVEDIIKFYWKEGSSSIEYKYLKHADDKVVHYWLLHTFFPLYYILENIYDMLHVGAVEINGKACLFAAPSFGGKSTLTYHFLQKGHSLLSDDKLALFKKDNGYVAVPSYPYTRNYRGLEDLGKYVKNFSKRSLPVGYMYRLVQVGIEEEISIQEVKGVDKFAIVEMSCDIKLSMMKKEKFSQLHDMVQNLTIYDIGVPQNLNRLDEVYEKIIGHFKR